MPAENIFAQYARPLRSVAEYSTDMDAQDINKLKLVGLQRANDTAAITNQQTLQDAADRHRSNAMIRAAYAGLAPNAAPDDVIKALRATGDRGALDLANTQETQYGTRQKTEAEAKAKHAEVLGKVLAAQGELAGRVMANPTREAAAAAVANMKAITQALGVPIDMSADEAAIGQFQTPEDVKRWAAGHALKAQELLPRLQNFAAGGSHVNQMVDPITGKVTDTGQTAITQSADSIAREAVQRRGQDIAAGTAAAGRAQADRHFSLTQDASAGQMQKAPAGYMWGPDDAQGNKTMIAVKGGPADLKLAGQLNADTQALSGATSGLDRLAAAANEALQHPGLPGTYGLRGVVPNIPGSQAADAAALLNTLKSQVGFSVLQDMRNTSKTGGALGAVSDKENAMLQANLAALEKAQSIEQAKASLAKIVKYTDEAKGRLRDAYNMRHGDKPAAKAAPAVDIHSQADAILRGGK